MNKIKFVLITFLLIFLSGCVEDPVKRVTDANIKENARGFYLAAELQCAKNSIENPDMKTMGVKTVPTEGYLSMEDVTSRAPKPTEVNIQFDSNCIASGTITIEGNTFDIIKDFVR